MNHSKPLPPTYLLIAVAAAAALHFFIPLAKIVPFPWNTVGAIFLLIGIALNLIGDRRFKQLGTTIKPFEESSALVTTGIFRLSRNPMYLGFALLLAGVAVLFGTLTPFLVPPIFVVFVEKRFIIHEERMLEKTFGVTYLDYKRRVRRWI